jgi:hypothetical protein
MSNDPKIPSVDDLLLMVDMTPPESREYSHPIITHFEEVMKHYLDWVRSKGAGLLTQVAQGVKYHAMLTAFCSKHKDKISKDDHGQFIKLDNGVKLRPINVKGQALLLGAHQFRVEH